MRDEQRASKRKWLSFPAVLARPGGETIRPCQIVDVSETGMKLTLLEPMNVAGEIIVLLSKDGSVRRTATLKWQAGREIGLRFSRRYGASRTAATAETVLV
jgi:PilZ domain